MQSQQLCFQQLQPQPSSSCSLQNLPYQPPAPVQRQRLDQCSSSQNSQNEAAIPITQDTPRLLNGLPSPHGPLSIPSSSHHQPIYQVIGDQIPNLTGTECTICYENPIDSVLYMCGHMCMCYRCAVQQWRGKGGGQCPLCRATIKDVIRTYKS